MKQGLIPFRLAQRQTVRKSTIAATSIDPNRLLSAPETKITTLPSGLRIATEQV
jgi:hypothetical protein